MKALSLWQPWASLIAIGAKTIETRSWSTSYRGRLAIHASKKSVHDMGIDLNDFDVVLHEKGSTCVVDLPLGAIVATCTLVDVVPMVDLVTGEGMPEDGGSPLVYIYPGAALFLSHHFEVPVRSIDITDQGAYGDFTPGRYAWLLEDIKPTTECCPACWGRCSLAPDPICGDSSHRHSGGCKLYVGRRRCATCDGKGTCDPVPATGHQGLWERSA